MRGLIISSVGSSYQVKDEQGNLFTGRLRGRLKQEGMKSNNPIAVGDYVEYEMEDLAQNTVVISDILERENYLIRQSTHKKGGSQIIAANIDQALLIVTLVLPRTSLGFIDRFLVSAEAFRIPTILIFNKKDLLDEETIAWQEELMAMYRKIGYPAYSVSAFENSDIQLLKTILEGKIA